MLGVATVITVRGGHCDYFRGDHCDYFRGGHCDYC